MGKQLFAFNALRIELVDKVHCTDKCCKSKKYEMSMYLHGQLNYKV